MTAMAVSAQAASITLESINSGVFQYQLVLAPGDDVVFSLSSQISLTGLAGVTAISPINIGFTSCGFTGTSACFAEAFDSQTFSNPGSDPTAFNLFTITSTAASVGLVDYSAQATSPFSGEVDGPSPAPEPNAGLLTGAGLLGLILFASLIVKR